VIKVTNLDSFDATVQRWFKDVEKAAAEAAVGLAHAAFEQLLETSPQYSGDFVANWTVSDSATSNTFTPNAVGGYAAGVSGVNKLSPLHQMGDTPAMAYARSHAKWPKITLGKSVYLHNNASHSAPYAMKIEQGQIKLRPVNEGADHVVRRAIATVAFNFHNIGPVQLDGLRKFKK
jgi:hypothetical protein